MMWFLRRPRKLLFIVLSGAFIWTLSSYFFTKLHGRSSDNNQRTITENTDLSQYDELLPENVFWKNTEKAFNMNMNKHDPVDEKSKFDAAVDREEKDNFIKHERLKLNLEDIEVMNQLPEKSSNELISYQELKYKDKPKLPEISQPILSSASSLSKYDLSKGDSSRNYGHNESVSQTISVRRSLPDVRDALCRNIKYSDNLPDVSVIIVFYNEAWTTLLRTIHSVIDRSPPQLIREIILIDDYSDYENLQLQLKDYLSLLPKVSLRRTTGRVGIVAGRQIGASIAVGSVLIFLDSHCECTSGWLEPLLDRIQENESHVVTPVMDIIDDQTFEYNSFDVKSINVGGFDWNLQFIWIGVSERIKKLQKSDIDFIRSPTMPGGMFAISKKYFHQLGGYDPGMNMWGGENLEMSFKIWMCGGTLETVPCSHVGHLFRHGTSYNLGNGDSHKNYYRLAEVWLDEFKELYYQKINNAVEFSEDIVSRKALRKQLGCKSFSWYLENIYPELFVPTEALASGEIRNKDEAFADGTRFPGCLDGASSTIGAAVKIWPCHNQGGNQLWMLSKSGEIRRDDGCMDFSGEKVVILPCHGQRGNQAWEYLSIGLIKHSNSKLCMGLSSDGGALAMSACSGRSDQIWHWKRQQTEKLTENENKSAQELAFDY